VSAPPSRNTPGGRAYLDLQAAGRRDGRSTDELLALYVLEGFLDRLSASRYAASLVLKGGALLAAYDTRRPTRDVDLHARALSNDAKDILVMVCEIASVVTDDGLEYDIGSARAEVIRDDETYSGARITMICRLATARLNFHVDVNVGDPVWPEPSAVELPRLLGGSITLRGYPLAMVHAEKIITAIQRGISNTRWRDFADVYLLSGRHPIDGAELRQSLVVVADYRIAAMLPLSQALDGYSGLMQSRWASWISRQRLDDRLPLSLDDVISHVAQFADPALRDEVDGVTWDPSSRTWSPSADH
jgi:hypothetical protein